MTLTQKQRSNLQAKLAIIEKALGAGSVMLMDKNMPIVQCKIIPTGSLAFDQALGVGGWPRGRVIEIYGPESSGKSTLCLQAIAEAQRLGLVCAYIDAEHAFDTLYATHLGVDVDALVISQPDNGEQGLEVADSLVKTGDIALIVIDSVAALVPKAELEGDMGKSHMGLQARLMSQALRKLTAIVSKNDVLVMFINQIRMKIGVMFGNPETTTGGNALKFYASVRVDVRRIGAIKRGEENIGNRLKVKVVKNKVAPPFREAEFNLIFGQGIDWAAELLEMGTAYKLVEKTGAWFSYAGERIGQGKDKAAEFLRGTPAVADPLREQLINFEGAVVATEDDDDAEGGDEGDGK